MKKAHSGMKFPVKKIRAGDLPGEVLGAVNKTITFVSNLENAMPDCLVFCNHDRMELLKEISAGIALCPPETAALGISTDNLVLVLNDNPMLEFAKILHANGYSNKCTSNSSMLFRQYLVEPSQSYIESDVTIGAETEIFPFVSIFSGTSIGRCCSVQSGVRIGAAGLAYALNGNDYIKFPHLGRAVIGDFIDIGSNSEIMRGILQDTVIGNGTKIGSGVTIGHNVRIGSSCFISSGTTLCGSVVVGDHCWIAPNCCVLNGVVLAEGTKVSIGSVLATNSRAWGVYAGNPARLVKLRKGKS
jgi:UDP-3-O-[3-hydroxymyristoyl] glucosamine N-acyltransferase